MEKLTVFFVLILILETAAAGLFLKTEFQSWAWQRLFQQKAENQRTRSASMCGAACSFLGEECNAFQYDPAATHCRVGKVLCKITKDRKERSLTNVFISKTLSTCEASGSGVILTGGKITSAEVVFPASGKICPLPDLPSSRREHSQDGLVMCGAKEDKTSCLTLSEVGWTKSHDLIKERFNHISWQMEEGILLMGGASSPDSTELGDQILKTIPRIIQYSVRPDGTTEESFSLKYSISHSSCSIPFDDHVLVIGGNSLDSHERVTKYGLAGWLEDFPNLITGRRKHGCGQYTDISGRQVYLVAGGENRRGQSYLNSTEILVAGTYAWTLVSPLPQKYWYFRMVTLANTPHMFGGENGAAQPTILKYSPESDIWEQLGMEMTARRTQAGTSLIDAEEVFRWCFE